MREAEKAHADDHSCYKEYAPVDGDLRLKKLTQDLAFGQRAPAVTKGRIASSQTLSGTGSLRVAGEFIKAHMAEAAHTMYVSQPTWGNHIAIFKRSGMTVKEYPYWSHKCKCLDFDRMIATLTDAPNGSSVLLHAVAHNPTGMDPTQEQWTQIVELVRTKKFVVLLDSAYQGFASGDLDTDRFSTSLLEASGAEFIVCQSFAKNMGLYGERVGMVHFVCASVEAAKCVLSQLKLVVRPMYSSPPIHGGELVIRVLGDEQRCLAWKQELKETALRIHKMRCMPSRMHAPAAPCLVAVHPPRRSLHSPMTGSPRKARSPLN